MSGAITNQAPSTNQLPANPPDYDEIAARSRNVAVTAFDQANQASATPGSQSLAPKFAQLGQQNAAQAAVGTAESAAAQGGGMRQFRADMRTKASDLMKLSATAPTPGAAREARMEAMDDLGIANNPSLAASATPDNLDQLTEQGQQILSRIPAGGGPQAGAPVKAKL